MPWPAGPHHVSRPVAGDRGRIPCPRADRDAPTVSVPSGSSAGARGAVADVLRAWPAVAAAAVAVLVARLVPLVSPLLWALLLGVLLANLPRPVPRAILVAQPGAKTLLRWGIVAFGSLVSWGALREVGWAGAAVVVSTVVVVFAATCWLGDRWGLPRGLVTMVAAGVAVCGAAAVAAVEGNIRRRDEDVGVALALVTLCGTVMIVLVPLAGGWLGLTPDQIGVWAGASIHEVAQVVAAAALVGSSSVLAVAMAVKLGRVALLVVAHWGALAREGVLGRGRRSGSPVLPWFLVGFVLVAVVSSTGLLPAPVVDGLARAGSWLLAAGMFGLGLGIDRRQIFPLPAGVLRLALASTALAALLPLGLILLLIR